MISAIQRLRAASADRYADSNRHSSDEGSCIPCETVLPQEAYPPISFPPGLQAIAAASVSFFALLFSNRLKKGPAH